MIVMLRQCNNDLLTNFEATHPQSCLNMSEPLANGYDLEPTADGIPKIHGQHSGRPKRSADPCSAPRGAPCAGMFSQVHHAAGSKQLKTRLPGLRSPGIGVTSEAQGGRWTDLGACTWWQKIHMPKTWPGRWVGCFGRSKPQ